MELNNKNKIGEGIIVQESGTNLLVGFHKVGKIVYVKYPSKNHSEFFCTFKEFKNRKNEIKDFNSYPNLMKVQLEYTDTFGGEANYSWVNRKEIEVLQNISDVGLIRIAKKEMGIQLRHKSPIDCGDYIRLDFYNSATVLFITFVY